MNIVSPKSTRKYRATLDDYYIWLKCVRGHRFLAHNEENCHCCRHGWFLRALRSFVLCA